MIFGIKKRSEMTEAEKLEDNAKWKNSFVAAMLFVVLSLPQVYNAVQSGAAMLGLKNYRLFAAGGGPTMPGIIAHAAIFTVVCYILTIQSEKMKKT